MVDRQEVRAEARLRVADRARNGLFVFVVMLGERGVQELHDRDVETVKPEDSGRGGFAS